MTEPHPSLVSGAFSHHTFSTPSESNTPSLSSVPLYVHLNPPVAVKGPREGGNPAVKATPAIVFYEKMGLS